ncbi:DUF3037 domain-containing protein [Flavobacterium sp. DG1-102-2]|uniref:DUF3037 domain-containing protein n=1 Tax=Flavobacterium sp. DG1-102-2 TaxID=3081663 RepID=UPI002949521F|nr:DUF3037 domain-containing protein [Flavobacterium sp. DG1-102-2]MDV6169700.1 DUF3037 domain-containing protein [Flavobacterium sp. DG1-102-2]
MQEKHLYEYAVIRVVPRVEREEFVNAGVVVFCKRKRYVKVLFTINQAKLIAIDPEIDVDQIRLNLESFQKIGEGAKNGGPIATLEAPERFRWLTAIRSSVIQTSRPHPGLCDDIENLAQKLFDDYVA